MPIAFLPSGSGKTDYIRTKAPRQTRTIHRQTPRIFALQHASVLGSLNEDDVVGGVVDGDVIIARTIGWPDGEWWDELPKPEVRAFITQCWEQFELYSRHFLVLTGVGPVDEEHAVQLIKEFDLNEDNFFFAMPTLSALERNMKSRAAKKSPSNPQPVDAERAYQTGLDTFAMFEGHVNWSRTHIGANIPMFLTDLHNGYAKRKKGIIRMWTNGEEIQVLMRGYESPSRLIHARKTDMEFSRKEGEDLHKWWILMTNSHTSMLEVVNDNSVWKEVYLNDDIWFEQAMSARAFGRYMLERI